MQTKSFWVGALVIVIFSLAVWGTYVLYQKRVSKPSPTLAPSPVTGFPSSQEASPTPPVQGTTAPDSQPATGVTSLPETGGR